jgi:bifunctional DNase/RNase
VPQPQSTLSGYRSVGAALRSLLEVPLRRIKLTLAAVSSKIHKGNDSVSAQLGSGQRLPYKRSFMAGPKEDFILMMVGGLTLDPTTKMPIVVLKDPDNKLNLPIWIGPLEAASMAYELEGVRPARPMTHDLLRNLLGDLGATVEAVEITELRENTYYARIEVKTRDGAAVGVDSRPSDAISIALRTKSPIYVAKAVLESSSELRESAEQAVSAADQNLAGVSRDKWSEILEKMSPEDFKYKM